MKNASRHLLGATLLLGLTTFTALAKPPNIVLILTDDQGWNNTEVPMMPSRADTRSDFYLTPNFKRLADAGMIFSQAYAPHPVCSPSHHAIQFGMTPAKLKKTTNRAVNYPEPFLTPAILQVLKSIDPAYRAAHFGQWHMHRHPAELGYDASDGRNVGDQQFDDFLATFKSCPMQRSPTQRILRIHISTCFYLSHSARHIIPKTPAEIAEELIAQKRANGMSGRYCDDLRYRCGRFAQTFQCEIGSLTPALV